MSEMGPDPIDWLPVAALTPQEPICCSTVTFHDWTRASDAGIHFAECRGTYIVWPVTSGGYPPTRYGLP